MVSMTSTTTIQVSQFVKEKLDRIKERNGHTSMDSVLRYLLNEAEKHEANATNR